MTIIEAGLVPDVLVGFTAEELVGSAEEVLDAELLELLLAK